MKLSLKVKCRKGKLQTMLTVHGKFMNQLTGTLNEKLMVHIFLSGR
jgi:hypothetical protein